MDKFAEFVSNHMVLSASFFGLLAYWIFGELKSRASGVGTVGAKDAIQLMNHSNAVVIDVREEKEVVDGMIINSVHIPLDDLQNHLKKIEKYKDKPVIVSCRTGNRSGKACNMLRKNGFLQVYNLRGGILAWQKENLPLVKK